VYVRAGTYAGEDYTTGKYPIELHKHDQRHADQQHLRDQRRVVRRGAGANAQRNQSHRRGVEQHRVDLAGSTEFASGTPANIQSLFTMSNPNLAKDSYGIYRPSAAGPASGLGYTGTTTSLARNSDVGASWMSPALRLNKMMVGEFQFKR